MASLRKKSGHYYARFYDANRSPKQKEKALRTTRKSVARKRLVKWERAYEEGEFDPWRGGWLIENDTVPDAVERFLNDKERDGLRPNTLSSYRYKLEVFTEHTPPGIMIRDVEPNHIHNYVHASKKNGGAPSNATKRSRYRHVRDFFSWAVDQSLADESPVDDVTQPRKEKKTKAFLRPEDIERILRAVDAHRKMRDGEPGPTPQDEWIKQIIRVAVGTGLRRGELLNLRWGDVDLHAGRLVVRNREDFTAKNGHERVVPLAGDALDTLQAMHDARDPLDGAPVFVDAKNDVPKPDRVSKRFKFYVRKARLKHREELSFHSCRHTTGSWLSMQGVPLRVISEILGHSSTEVTEMYSHLQPEVMHRAMRETFETDA
jgi:site-specific recombinase XerD